MSKQKGWPADCRKCQMWKEISSECSAENSNGKCPCEAISKKHFDYLVKQAQEE